MDDDLQTLEVRKSSVVDFDGRAIPFTDLTITPEDSLRSRSKKSSDSDLHIPSDGGDESVTSVKLIKKIKEEKK